MGKGLVLVLGFYLTLVYCLPENILEIDGRKRDVAPAQLEKLLEEREKASNKNDEKSPVEPSLAVATPDQLEPIPTEDENKPKEPTKLVKEKRLAIDKAPTPTSAPELIKISVISQDTGNQPIVKLKEESVSQQKPISRKRLAEINENPIQERKAEVKISFPKLFLHKQRNPTRNRKLHQQAQKQSQIVQEVTINDDNRKSNQQAQKQSQILQEVIINDDDTPPASPGTSNRKSNQQAQKQSQILQDVIINDDQKSPLNRKSNQQAHKQSQSIVQEVNINEDIRPPIHNPANIHCPAQNLLIQHLQKLKQLLNIQDDSRCVDEIELQIKVLQSFLQRLQQRQDPDSLLQYPKSPDQILNSILYALSTYLENPQQKLDIQSLLPPEHQNSDLWWQLLQQFTTNQKESASTNNLLLSLKHILDRTQSGNSSNKLDLDNSQILEIINKLFPAIAQDRRIQSLPPPEVFKIVLDLLKNPENVPKDVPQDIVMEIIQMEKNLVPEVSQDQKIQNLPLDKIIKILLDNLQTQNGPPRTIDSFVKDLINKIDPRIFSNNKLNLPLDKLYKILIEMLKNPIYQPNNLQKEIETKIVNVINILDPSKIHNTNIINKVPLNQIISMFLNILKNPKNQSLLVNIINNLMKNINRLPNNDLNDITSLIINIVNKDDEIFRNTSNIQDSRLNRLINILEYFLKSPNDLPQDVITLIINAINKLDPSTKFDPNIKNLPSNQLVKILLDLFKNIYRQPPVLPQDVKNIIFHIIQKLDVTAKYNPNIYQLPLDQVFNILFNLLKNPSSQPLPLDVITLIKTIINKLDPRNILNLNIDNLPVDKLIILLENELKQFNNFPHDELQHYISLIAKFIAEENSQVFKDTEINNTNFDKILNRIEYLLQNPDRLSNSLPRDVVISIINDINELDPTIIHNPEFKNLPLDQLLSILKNLYKNRNNKTSDLPRDVKIKIIDIIQKIDPLKIYDLIINNWSMDQILNILLNFLNNHSQLNELPQDVISLIVSIIKRINPEAVYDPSILNPPFNQLFKILIESLKYPYKPINVLPADVNTLIIRIINKLNPDTQLDPNIQNLSLDQLLKILFNLIKNPDGKPITLPKDVISIMISIINQLYPSNLSVPNFDKLPLEQLFHIFEMLLNNLNNPPNNLPQDVISLIVNIINKLNPKTLYEKNIRNKPLNELLDFLFYLLRNPNGQPNYLTKNVISTIITIIQKLDPKIKNPQNLPVSQLLNLLEFLLRQPDSQPNDLPLDIKNLILKIITKLDPRKINDLNINELRLDQLLDILSDLLRNPESSSDRLPQDLITLLINLIYKLNPSLKYDSSLKNLPADQILKILFNLLKNPNDQPNKISQDVIQLIINLIGKLNPVILHNENLNDLPLDELINILYNLLNSPYGPSKNLPQEVITLIRNIIDKLDPRLKYDPKFQNPTLNQLITILFNLLKYPNDQPNNFPTDINRLIVDLIHKLNPKMIDDSNIYYLQLDQLLNILLQSLTNLNIQQNNLPQNVISTIISIINQLDPTTIYDPYINILPLDKLINILENLIGNYKPKNPPQDIRHSIIEIILKLDPRKVNDPSIYQLSLKQLLVVFLNLLNNPNDLSKELSQDVIILITDLIDKLDPKLKYDPKLHNLPLDQIIKIFLNLLNQKHDQPNDSSQSLKQLVIKIINKLDPTTIYDININDLSLDQLLKVLIHLLRNTNGQAKVLPQEVISTLIFIINRLDPRTLNDPNIPNLPINQIINILENLIQNHDNPLNDLPLEVISLITTIISELDPTQVYPNINELPVDQLLKILFSLLRNPDGNPKQLPQDVISIIISIINILDPKTLDDPTIYNLPLDQIVNILANLLNYSDVPVKRLPQDVINLIITMIQKLDPGKINNPDIYQLPVDKLLNILLRLMTNPNGQPKSLPREVIQLMINIIYKLDSKLRYDPTFLSLPLDEIVKTFWKLIHNENVHIDKPPTDMNHLIISLFEKLDPRTIDDLNIYNLPLDQLFKILLNLLRDPNVHQNGLPQEVISVLIVIINQLDPSTVNNPSILTLPLEQLLNYLEKLLKDLNILSNDSPENLRSLIIDVIKKLDPKFKQDPRINSLPLDQLLNIFINLLKIASSQQQNLPPDIVSLILNIVSKLNPKIKYDPTIQNLTIDQIIEILKNVLDKPPYEDSHDVVSLIIQIINKLYPGLLDNQSNLESLPLDEILSIFLSALKNSNYLPSNVPQEVTAFIINLLHKLYPDILLNNDVQNLTIDQLIELIIKFLKINSNHVPNTILRDITSYIIHLINELFPGQIPNLNNDTISFPQLLKIILNLLENSDQHSNSIQEVTTLVINVINKLFPGTLPNNNVQNLPLDEILTIVLNTLKNSDSLPNNVPFDVKLTIIDIFNKLYPGILPNRDKLQQLPFQEILKILLQNLENPNAPPRNVPVDVTLIITNIVDELYKRYKIDDSQLIKTLKDLLSVIKTNHIPLTDETAVILDLLKKLDPDFVKNYNIHNFELPEYIEMLLNDLQNLSDPEINSNTDINTILLNIIKRISPELLNVQDVQHVPFVQLLSSILHLFMQSEISLNQNVAFNETMLIIDAINKMYPKLIRIQKVEYLPYLQYLYNLLASSTFPQNQLNIIEFPGADLDTKISHIFYDIVQKIYLQFIQTHQLNNPFTSHYPSTLYVSFLNYLYDLLYSNLPQQDPFSPIKFGPSQYFIPRKPEQSAVYDELINTLFPGINQNPFYNSIKLHQYLYLSYISFLQFTYRLLYENLSPNKEIFINKSDFPSYISSRDINLSKVFMDVIYQAYPGISNNPTIQNAGGIQITHVIFIYDLIHISPTNKIPLPTTLPTDPVKLEILKQIRPEFSNQLKQNIKETAEHSQHSGHYVSQVTSSSKRQYHKSSNNVSVEIQLPSLPNPDLIAPQSLVSGLSLSRPIVSENPYSQMGNPAKNHGNYFASKIAADLHPVYGSKHFRRKNQGSDVPSEISEVKIGSSELKENVHEPEGNVTSVVTVDPLELGASDFTTHNPLLVLDITKDKKLREQEMEVLKKQNQGEREQIMRLDEMKKVRELLNAIVEEDSIGSPAKDEIKVPKVGIQALQKALDKIEKIQNELIKEQTRLREEQKRLLKYHEERFEQL